MRCTCSSSSACEMGPESTDALYRSLNQKRPGSSLSRPAAEAFSVECVPPQSDSTKPGNFQSFLSTSVSSHLFSQAKSPLTRLYEHITAAGCPLVTPISN